MMIKLSDYVIDFKTIAEKTVKISGKKLNIEIETNIISKAELSLPT